LSSSVPQHCIDLNDSLDKELMIRPQRTAILTSLPDLDTIEKEVHHAVSAVSSRLEQLATQLNSLNEDQETLKTKIAHRRRELERQIKRLVGMCAVRPAYIDEYEQLEEELARLFALHFQHYRTVDHLQHELETQAAKKASWLAKGEQKMERMRRRRAKELAGGIEDSIKGIAFDPTDESLLARGFSDDDF
jgi:clusterin-associated protein 1